MDQSSGEAAQQTATMLRLAMQLRDAAADADRQDVIAQVDDLLSLIAGEKISAGPGAAKAGTGTPNAGTGTLKAGPGVAENVQRILNGLGF